MRKGASDTSSGMYKIQCECLRCNILYFSNMLQRAGLLLPPPVSVYTARVLGCLIPGTLRAVIVWVRDGSSSLLCLLVRRKASRATPASLVCRKEGNAP